MRLSLHSADLQFLREKISEDVLGEILGRVRVESREHPSANDVGIKYSLNISNEEAELVQDCLAVSLTEIGIGSDGEPNAVGIYIERLIDLFCYKD